MTRTDSDDPLSRLLAAEPGPFRSARRSAGERLLHGGEPIERVFFVATGLVMLSVGSASGEEQACGLRGRGALLGWEALVGHAAALDAKVVSGSQILAAELPALQAWLETRTGAREAVLRAVAAEATRLALERSFLIGPAPQRLARFLVQRSRSDMLASWRQAPLHAIAGLLFMRPETLSRALRELQKAGLIEDGRDLRVLDLDGLATFGGERS